MNAGAYVGRVGGLAVALGVGLAAATGYGGAAAWADTPSSPDSSAESSSAESVTPSAATDPEVDGADPAEDQTDSSETGDETPTDQPVDETSSDAPADQTPTQDAPSDEARTDEAPVEGGTENRDEPPADAEPTQEPHRDAERVGDSDPVAAQPDADETSSLTSTSDVAAADPPLPRRAESEAAASLVLQTLSIPDPQRAATVSTLITPPAAPSLRLWPTAFDPFTVVTYVTHLVSSLVNAVLSPFTAGLPAPPTGPPTLWTLLAWVRREFLNSSPSINYDPVDTSQGVNEDGDVVITGNIGATDPDGDPLRYTVIGRPLNGGVVEIADDGTFTYRPMNAMAAVGGTDQFVVVVDDEKAGFHVNGLRGLLQFVPIIGNLLYPGGGHRVARTITVNVDAVEGVDLSLPDDFHWGVAHSGFQAEGGPGSPVDPNSDWYNWVHDPFNQLLGLTSGVPENGPGAYANYDTDAGLARDQLGMNTFRMSIEWSRIFPNSTAAVDISDEGGAITLADLQALDALANQDEVQHYRDVLASLRAHDLEPLITVTHFTMPTWVHDPITTRVLVQLGLPAPAAGWLSPTTPVEFEKYAAYLAWKYGDQVDNWATINEPFPPILTQYLSPPIPGSPIPNWPPGIVRPDLAATFLVNQAKGHVAAYDAIHAWDVTAATEGQPAAFVGFTNNMIPARPANPVNPLDVQAADAWNRYYNLWFPNAVIDGWVDANFDGIKTANEIHADYIDKLDFMGVQYYGSQPMQGFGLAPVPGLPFLQGLPVRCAASSPTCSDFNQPTDPGGFREVLEIAASYGKPVWITENGIADAGDSKRPSYIANHIAVVQDMVAHGTDIRGYTYWSFVDNLEWANGYDLQFGLYGSDPTTPEFERTPKPDSIAAISSITGLNALPLALLQRYIPGANFV